ncbi:MAG: hypothetical protein EAX96_06305 [Candidatus Lokiarchaeota archaeon]|nr:hypothetical protein [Candidatus Lokiarchaeota archaeon]
MGRSIPTYRMLLENEISSWSAFQKSLKKQEDREAFDEIMNNARLLADAGTMVTRPFISQIMFMSILIKQQDQICKINKKINSLKKRDLVIDQET